MLSLAKNIDFLRRLEVGNRALLITRFLRKQRAVIVEYFAVTWMPPEFVAMFDRKRSSYSVKEAFRRSVSTLCYEVPVEPPTLRVRVMDAILAYIYTHGAFRLDDLPKALRHPPTHEESAIAYDYMNQVNPEELRRALSIHQLAQGGTHAQG